MSLHIESTSIAVPKDRVITLEMMKSVKLMNRTDSKYVGPASKLEALLSTAIDRGYSVQAVGEKFIAEYDTYYFDTPSCDCYLMHHNGHLTRQKLRTRLYKDSSHAFIEIKNKNNRGRTKKKRMQIPPESLLKWKEIPEAADFARGMLKLPYDTFSAALRTSFRRITLVNRERTERVTIDMGLSFSNLRNGRTARPGDIIIVEVKQDGTTGSTMKGILTELKIRRMGFSKYCIGTAMTDPGIRQNRFKEKYDSQINYRHVKHIAVNAGV